MTKTFFSLCSDKYSRHLSRKDVVWLTHFIILFAVIIVTNIANANPEDLKQPVEITADQLISNEKQGSSQYQGAVLITQGTFKLQGDSVFIAHPQNQLETIKALGTPATFKQFNNKSNNWISGHAQEIFYNAKSKTIQLTGQALVKQENKHEIRGESLTYDMVKQTLQGSGSEQQQIQVILQPNQQPAPEQQKLQTEGAP